MKTLSTRSKAATPAATAIAVLNQGNSLWFIGQPPRRFTHQLVSAQAGEAMREDRLLRIHFATETLSTTEASSSYVSKTVYSLVSCRRSSTPLARFNSLIPPPARVTVVCEATSSPSPELSI